MPIGSDPDDLIEFSLLTDRGKTPTPVFLLRFQTDRESRKVARLIQAAGAETDDEKAGALLDEACAIGLAGVRHVTHRGQPVDYPGTALSDFLSINERWELASAVLNEPHVTESSRKKSLRQSTSAPATSAPTAAPPDAASPIGPITGQR